MKQTQKLKKQINKKQSNETQCFIRCFAVAVVIVVVVVAVVAVVATFVVAHRAFSLLRQPSKRQHEDATRTRTRCERALHFSAKWE